MIRHCGPPDFEVILSVINDGATAYRGVVPADRLHYPYMSADDLRHEVAAGVDFYGDEEDGELLGVMGMQFVQDVTLIRHAYVRMAAQGRGIGGRLLDYIRPLARGPILLGTWADSYWAIGFYGKHGFRLVSHAEKEYLLRRYWQIPERQVETSIVFVDAGWSGLAIGT